MHSEPFIAFATKPDPPALEIRINFGVFAGRDATPAELDELARLLLPEGGAVSIVAEVRHEVSAESEVALHQVRVEVAGDQLPAAAAERDAFTDRLVGVCERWASACVAARHAEVSEF
jgi:formate dehydrogenase assembly factor FdhD